MITSGHISDTMNAIKVISFGQSRCTSSQKTTTDQYLMNASLGGHQGIMTFGNFASLLKD